MAIDHVDVLQHTSVASERERRDRLSDLMGQYLLKGWRMLDAYCSDCQVSVIVFSFCIVQNILFERPGGEQYCIDCSELSVAQPKLTHPASSTKLVTNGFGHVIASQNGDNCSVQGDNPLTTAPSTLKYVLHWMCCYHSSVHKRS